MVEFQLISLATKPTAQISYSFQPAVSTTKPALLVFLNGLGLPQVSWLPAIAQLKELRQENIPATLTYDRFGQGQTTDRDPSDEGVADLMHGHDCLSVVRDLHQLITQVIAEKLDVSETDSVPLVLVGNSIGCALARLYAQEYPGTVAGLLFLDSVLANSDFVSVFPDPDAEDFDDTTLPPGIPPQALRATREGTRRVFHPDVGSKEGLSRKNLRTLLPASDGPVLQGPGGRGPFVTVVGHDFEAFAEESAKMGPPKLITMTYVNPYWHRYNEGLAKITEPEKSKGPLQAPNAGHFVQRDNPAFVAHELNELLSKVL
ncbi:Alpha/Beta hydrolase protein [Talaromyces proteolyticus]|uniref:Alpha/Beta hydrolase protein n=1 Tax=Talaromyces proteolyticus TaxID=1131652 RepID=A0AAD4KL98_9EURO|nr:Alpha/Beta hydrolase protein [Talaromyces proteolyticus]KAH8693741.1 Alpha/Beta hydrolase protein [Talaromyces proteolyticus]